MTAQELDAGLVKAMEESDGEELTWEEIKERVAEIDKENA